MVSPAIFGGILSAFVIAAVASKEYTNYANDKKSRRDDLDWRRRQMYKKRR